LDASAIQQGKRRRNDAFKERAVHSNACQNPDTYQHPKQMMRDLPRRHGAGDCALLERSAAEGPSPVRSATKVGSPIAPRFRA
jgi:hypothetical protein